MSFRFHSTVLLLFALVVVLGAFGCGRNSAGGLASSAVPRPTATPPPTAAPEPTQTAYATGVVEPRVRATPTAIAAATRTPNPTATAQPVGTSTPLVDSETPSATPTPTVTATPHTLNPTATAQPVDTPTTPIASVALSATLTPTPTVTARHTPHATTVTTAELHAAIDAMPWLADGATKWETLAADSLRYMSSIDVESVALMLGFPWVIDGVTAAESSAITSIMGLLGEHPPFARDVLNLWWVPDGITTVEQHALLSLRILAGRNLQLAMQVTKEPFMGPPFRQRDEYVLNVFSSLSWDPPENNDNWALLAQLDAQPWFSDGLDDLEAALVYAIALSSTEFRQALIKTHYVEAAQVTLPLAGDVELIVVSHTPLSPGDHTLASLEEGVRAIEGFMGVPFPVTDLVTLLVEPGIWRVGGKVHMSVSGGGSVYITSLILAAKTESGPSRGSLYHEIGHHYYLVGPAWLTEGAAQFLEAYTLAQTGGDSLEQRLEYLESSEGCDRKNIQLQIEDWGGKQCDYYIGERFLLAMYAAMGREALSAALSDLHSQSLTKPYLDEETIYQAFQSSVSAGNEEAFKTAYRRYHGGPIVDAVTSDAIDLPPLAALYYATNGEEWENSRNWVSNAPLGSWHGVYTEPLGRIRVLELEENRLTGEIPSELGSLSELRRLFLSGNSLVGEIPSTLGSLYKLTWLRLGRNQLNGEIPRYLGNLTNVQALELWENRLTGNIPRELAGMRSLRGLDLQVNQLTGEIPPELAELINLTSLQLSRNRLRNYLKMLTHKCIEGFEGRIVWFLQNDQERP